MITNFLQHIIPSGGNYVLLTISSDGGRPKQHIYNDFQSMGNAAHAFNQQPDLDVYYAMANYTQGWHKSHPGGRNELRTASNAKSLKAIYFDIDVDPTDGNKYSSKDEAYAALVQYVHNEQLPAPLIVESANGFHGYWVLDQPIATAEWMPYATGVKEHMLRAGVKIDPAVTADPARVLRPIGTHNKKNGGAFPVNVVGPVPPVSPVSTFQKYWTDTPTSTKPQAPTPNKHLAGLYSGLVTPVGADDPNYRSLIMANMPEAEDIVKGCAQLQVSGSMTEPHWFGMMAIMAKAKGGREMAHYLSSLDPRYNSADTDEKFTTAVHNDHKPTLCTTFDRLNPGGCEGCPNRISGTKTPLYQRTDVEQHEQIEQAVEREIVPGFISQVLNGPDMWMWGVKISGPEHGIYGRSEEINSKTKDTEVSWDLISDRVILPIYKVNPVFNPTDTKGNHSRLFWREIKPTGEVRDLELSTSTLVNKQAFETWLLDEGVRVPPHQQDRMREFMRSVWSGAVDHVPDITEIDRMGWTKEKDQINVDGSVIPGRAGFALGEQVFWANAAPTVLQPSQDIVADTRTYGFCGTLAGWQEALHIIHNKDQVWAQAIVSGVLGSVMVEHMAARDGLPMIYVYSKGSGYAKSTAMKHAMGAWGSPAGQLVTGGSPEARINAMVRANSMPTLHDEMTLIHLKGMEHLLMSQSQGVEKDRMANTGGMSKFSRRQWHSLAFGNGNYSFADSIAAQTTNEGPLLARLIEVNLDHLPNYQTDVSIKTVFEKSEANHGVAGRIMVQHILDNLPACKAKLSEYHAEITKHYGGSSLERMWMAALAIIKFGCEVGRQIGIHPFTWDDVGAECERWIKDMRTHLGKSEEKEASSFGELIQHVYPGIIISNWWGPARDNVRCSATLVNEHSKPLARWDKEAAEITIPSSVLRRFAQDNGFEFNKSLDAWEASGRLVRKGVSARITSHAPAIKAPVPPERCYVFKLDDSDIDTDTELPEEVKNNLLNLYSGMTKVADRSEVYNDSKE